MKIQHLLLTAVAALALPFSSSADENHEIIEKVMKEALKGDESPLKKVVGKTASADEKKAFGELVATLDGTKAPVGEQGDYDEKVAALIEAANAAIAGDATEAHLSALEDAANCKACHKAHKPKKEE